MKVDIKGINPAIVTPFTRGGKHVDYEKACAIAVHLAKQGVHGLFVAGTTGESLLMTPEERKHLTEELVHAVGNKLNIIPQVGCLDTATTIDLAQHAFAVGAKAVGVVAPGFFTYDAAALKAHFKAVANAVEGPVLLYDIPSCAKNKITVELTIELANEVENIVGMKESDNDMVSFGRLVAELPKGFILINGVDEYSYQAYLTGAKGSVASSGNVAAKVMLGIYNNVQTGNLKQAWIFQEKLNEVCKMFRYGGLLALLKEALRLQGIEAGYVRPPQRELTAQEKRRLAKDMGRIGLI